MQRHGKPRTEIVRIMKATKICILGGTGFVGRHMVHQLALSGRQVTVLARQPQRHRDLAVTPGVRLARANIQDPLVLAEHFRAADCVINLVGILNEFPRKGVTFRNLHVELPKLVVEVCHETGVRRLLHMSALNADEARGSSEYLRTKGKGENHAHTSGKPDIAVTSFRPSVIFGPGDSFFNRFAALLRITPYVFPLACDHTQFAPVYVGDVARAFDQTIDDRGTHGKRYDLCGPRSFSLQELVKYTAKTCGLRRQIVGLGDRLSRLQSRILQFAPGKPFSYDNYLSLQSDSVCQEDGLATLGISATDINEIVPLYLGQRSTRARYSLYRQQAGREKS